MALGSLATQMCNGPTARHATAVPNARDYRTSSTEGNYVENGTLIPSVIRHCYPLFLSSALLRTLTSPSMDHMAFVFFKCTFALSSTRPSNCSNPRAA